MGRNSSERTVHTRFLIKLLIRISSDQAIGFSAGRGRAMSWVGGEWQAGSAQWWQTTEDAGAEVATAEWPMAWSAARPAAATVALAGDRGAGWVGAGWVDAGWGPWRGQQQGQQQQGQQQQGQQMEASVKELEARVKELELEAREKELEVWIRAEQLRIVAEDRVKELEARVKQLEEELAAAGNPGHGEEAPPPPPPLPQAAAGSSKAPPPAPRQAAAAIPAAARPAATPWLRHRQQQGQQQPQPLGAGQTGQQGWSRHEDVPWRTWPEAHCFEFRWAEGCYWCRLCDSCVDGDHLIGKQHRKRIVQMTYLKDMVFVFPICQPAPGAAVNNQFSHHDVPPVSETEFEHWLEQLQTQRAAAGNRLALPAAQGWIPAPGAARPPQTAAGPIQMPPTSAAQMPHVLAVGPPPTCVGCGNVRCTCLACT